MRIRIVEPLSPRQAVVQIILILVGVLFCVLALEVGMDYVRPYLDAKNREMLQRKQTIEDAARAERALEEDESDRQSVKAPIPPQQ